MLTIEKMLKSGHNNNNRNTWNYQEVIKNNKQRIFIYDYPIVEEFKEDFENHFCAHFYKREFAFTPGEFCYYLSEKLNNIFPYYNEVFKKIGNYDLLFGNGKETFTKNKTGNYNENENGNGISTVDTNRMINNKNRDFPTSAISDIDKYLTDTQLSTSDDLTKSEASNKNEKTNVSNENETYTRENNININLHDYLMQYRSEIDTIYEDLYIKFDELFLMVL
nr:MAG TPA: Lower collar protein [Caudoviricetes sp.]